MGPVEKILRDALAIVSHDGWWCKGAICRKRPNEPVAVCAHGALAVAAGTIPPIKFENGMLVYDEQELAALPDSRYPYPSGEWSIGGGKYYADAVVYHGNTDVRDALNLVEAVIRDDNEVAWSAQYQDYLLDFVAYDDDEASYSYEEYVSEYIGGDLVGMNDDEGTSRYDIMDWFAAAADRAAERGV